MHNPKISIITPNYNYGKFIGKTIESVVSQDYSNVEHIIVDDGSTDNSVEVISEYVLKYPDKVKLIQQENKGQTPAINRALKKATGDIIGWINSDDLFALGTFQIVLKKFSKGKNIDAVFGDIEIVNKEGKTIKKNKYLPFNYKSGIYLGFGRIISSNAIFWRKELTEEVGFLDERFDIAMDSEYWSRLLYRRKVKHVNMVFAQFRWHDEAKTIKRREKNSKFHLKGKEENRLIFENSIAKTNFQKLPANLHKMIKAYYKLRRYSLRFLYGHYWA